MKIIINIAGQDIILEKDEARKIYDELANIFEKPDPIYPRYPIFPPINPMSPYNTEYPMPGPTCFVSSYIF
jgi:hypothetical protein